MQLSRSLRSLCFHHPPHHIAGETIQRTSTTGFQFDRPWTPCQQMCWHPLAQTSQLQEPRELRMWIMMINQWIWGYLFSNKTTFRCKCPSPTVFQIEISRRHKSEAPQISCFGRQVWENPTQEAGQGLTPIHQGIAILMKNQLCVRMSFQRPAEGQPCFF